MNPGDRPRKALLSVVGAAVAIAAATTLVVATDTTPAAAGELERFASCEALAQWGAPDSTGAFSADGGAAVDVPTKAAEDQAPASGTTGGDEGLAQSAPAPDASAGSGAVAPDSPASTIAERSSEAGDADTTAGALAATDDDTNVIVQGVDELDVIDRLDADHVLVSAASRLSIIDLVDDEIVANLPVPYDAQITYDRANGIAWVVGPDDGTGRLTVSRAAVTTTTLAAGASWATDGWLVDARRVGDRLYLVAADGYDGYLADDGSGTPVPFAAGPVPCDQVLHPVVASDPTATLLVTLPATGELQPEQATEVVGSGELVHVTSDAAYLATPLYGDTVQTSIHRFDLADLRLTGSGRVDGSLLNEFSMSDYEGHLRVAVTHGGGGFGRAIEGDVIMPEAIAGEGTSGGTGGSTESFAPESVPTTRVEAQPSLNEIVVLDTDGALDVVGRTTRFGHPGETLQGVRFDGVVAYAVTFLQTDPFYVLDLSTPTAPVVAGQVELPGFSSYLHPVGDGLVAGFGPDQDGGMAVKLFDVSNRSQPTVVDTLDLGDESPIGWDHHAIVDLDGGRFAVPSTTYRELRPAGCTPERQRDLRAQEARLSAELNDLYARPNIERGSQLHLNELEQQSSELNSDGCLYPTSAPVSSVVVLETSGGHLQLVQRLGDVQSDEAASRAVQTDDGWALLVGNRWVVLDGSSGDQVADLELGPQRPVTIDDMGGGVRPSVGGVIVD